jgi:hypothetical protein
MAHAGFISGRTRMLVECGHTGKHAPWCIFPVLQACKGGRWRLQFAGKVGTFCPGGLSVKVRFDHPAAMAYTPVGILRDALASLVRSAIASFAISSALFAQ